LSLQEELEEVARWVANLTAPEPSAITEPLSREDWNLVEGDIGTVSGKLAEAQATLLFASEQKAPGNDFPSALVDLAADLTHQSQDLGLRARMLEQRAKHDSSERREIKATAREEAKKEREEKERAKREKKDEQERAKKEKRESATSAPAVDAHEAGQATPVPTKPPLQQAIDLLNAAQTSLGTTHGNLHVLTNLDFAATSFGGELEVLAEMTLTLTQQCERHLPQAATAG
jgi:hypothetical protein